MAVAHHKAALTILLLTIVECQKRGCHPAESAFFFPYIVWAAYIFLLFSSDASLCVLYRSGLIVGISLPPIETK